jgi:hypothetical protein
MDEKENYEVGYKNPPLHSQFKKGQSGNPRGRRKKEGPTILESLQAELKKSITVTEDGKSRRVTKLDVMIMQMVQRGMKGEIKASTAVFRLLQLREADSSASLPPVLELLRALNTKDEAADAMNSLSDYKKEKEDEQT